MTEASPVFTFTEATTAKLSMSICRAGVDYKW